MSRHNANLSMVGPRDPLVDAVLGNDTPGDPIPNAQVYRRMVHANLSEVISNALPVTADIVDGGDGLASDVSRFLSQGGPSTALYRDIPGDFVAWAAHDDHAYADLMAYEWLELVVARHPADVDDWATAQGASTDGSAEVRLVLNPTMQVGVYQRPVHQLCAETPSVPPFAAPKAYLVWRRPRTDEVAFHRVGLPLAQLLALAMERPLTEEALVDVGVTQLGLPRESLAQAISDTVSALMERDGVR